MIKIIFRIISILLLYLTASNYINFQTALITFGSAILLFTYDLYSYGFKVKISIQTIFSFIFLIILYLLNPYSLYISVLFLFLSLKPISNPKILLNYTYAACSALLIIGTISLLIFDVTYARYFNYVSYDIIDFLGTTPQQFGVLILTCAYLIFKSRKYLINNTSINPLLFLGLFVFLEYIIAERFLTFLCSVIFLYCVRSYKKFKLLFLPILSFIVLAIIFSSNFLPSGSVEILSPQLILERLERITDMIQLSLDLGPEVYSKFSARYYGIGDYKALGSLLSQGIIWAIVMLLVTVIYLFFYWAGRKKLDPLGLMLIFLLILKNSGRFNDPAIIFLLIATLISSFDYKFEEYNLNRKLLKN